MPKTDRAIELTDYERQDFSVCLGCKICASVCTVNDLDLSTNPQEMLQKLFLGKDVPPKTRWSVFVPAATAVPAPAPGRYGYPSGSGPAPGHATESPFEKAFKDPSPYGVRVYEPYVLMRAVPFLLKGGYIKHMTRWMEYMGIHLPHKVKRT